MEHIFTEQKVLQMQRKGGRTSQIICQETNQLHLLFSRYSMNLSKVNRYRPRHPQQQKDGQYFAQYSDILNIHKKITDLTSPDSQSEILILKIKKEEV